MLNLDPGIEALVELLGSHSFDTTDSGDGVSKPADARVFDVPHVFATVAAKDMVSEADRLQVVLETNDYHWHVEASYSPDDAEAHLFCRPPYSEAEQLAAMEGPPADYREYAIRQLQIAREKDDDAPASAQMHEECAAFALSVSRIPEGHEVLKSLWQKGGCIFCKRVPPPPHVTNDEQTAGVCYECLVKLAATVQPRSCVHCLGPAESTGKCKNSDCIGAEFSFDNPNGWPTPDEDIYVDGVRCED